MEPRMPISILNKSLFFFEMPIARSSSATQF
jgi:hypothetical protein